MESLAAWEIRQPPLGDLAERFVGAQQAVGSRVARAATWDAVPMVITPWIAEFGIRNAITGSVPVLGPIRRHLESLGVSVRTYDRPAEAARSELFTTDLGITTSFAAIAETGSIVLMPSPEEPRLLSLSVPVHLAIVERARLAPTLGDFVRSGAYQERLPANLVLVSGASRTADIELVLAMGVHGPKTLLVVLLG